MTELNPNAAAYAHQVRVRVCGICIRENKLLLVRHGQTIGNNAFWAPPGGGLHYGESMAGCLKRELREETGLIAEVRRFLFVNEFLQPPLHAVEFFFEVRMMGGELTTGADPEAAAGKQLIEHAAFLPLHQIQAIPLTDRHRILQHILSLDDLLGLPHHFVS